MAAPAEVVCNPRSFGAKGDGSALDTSSIQNAINKCAKTGGVVELKDGVFLSGTIYLKSNIELRVLPSATLKGSQDDSAYPDLLPPTINSQLSNCRKALVYVESAHDIKIDGGGTIDGSGTNPKWIGKEFTRPMAIFIALSQNLTIENLKVINAGMWSVVSFETDHVVMRSVTVHSPNGPTRDGIDIVDGHHVLIEDSTIFSEDDAICLKSGSPKGVYDVIVRNCQILQSSVANALKLGTASTGYFRKILFENIDIRGADKAAMAVESVDGADINDVQFHNIGFRNVGSAFFVLLGARGEVAKMGSIQNVSFSDIVGTTKHTWGSAVSGSIVKGKTYELKNVSFTNVNIKSLNPLSTIPADPAEYVGQYPDPNLWGNLPAFGFYLRHANIVNFDRVRMHSATSEARPVSFRQDVTNFSER